MADIARAENLRVLLIGGVAMRYYGSERLTVDLDVASSGMPARGLPREGVRTFGGMKTRTPSGVPLDWVVREDDFAPVFAEALEQGQRAIEGVPIDVVSPEYLAAMKMIAGRDRDDLDLIFLLQSGEVDVGKARRIIKRLLGAYAAQDFDSRVAEAEWKASREREE